MKKSLKQTVQQLYKTVKNHVGAGDEAHLIATNSNNGFLSAGDKRRYDSAAGDRVFLGSGVNILALEPGKYDGYSLINTPLDSSDTAMISVDITKGANYDANGEALVRKQISVVRSYDNKMWTNSIHQNGVATGWTEMLKMRKIWSGNVTSGSLDLSEPLSNFAHLLVEYEGKSVGIKKELVNAGTFFSLQPMNLSNATGSAIIELQETQLDVNKQSLVIQHNRLLTVNLSASPISVAIREDGEIKIYNIWGIPK